MSWHISDIARITFYFADDDDATGETRINIAVASLNQAVEYGRQLAALLKAVSSCALVKFHVVFTGYDDTPANLPATVDLMRRGVFLYQTSDSTLYVLKAVSIRPDLLLSTGPYAGVGVDLAQPAIAALAQATVEGIGGVQPCDEWGADLVQLVAAYRGYERSH